MLECISSIKFYELTKNYGVGSSITAVKKMYLAVHSGTYIQLILSH